VLDCAVVGVPDEEWGEVVSVSVVPRAGAEPSLEALREWARPMLSAYKLPRKLSLVDELPRNAMGKVIKTGIRG
jgi:acyl-coenzyme A synthetase/AMP-(fatty) acid ligase